jgi:hypothetical protein
LAPRPGRREAFAQFSDAEIGEMLSEYRAAMKGALGAASVDRHVRASLAVLAEADREHRERLEQWQRNAGNRERGQRAWERANAIRQAELGAGRRSRVPVMARVDLWGDGPERPRIWL